nr:hypothetical protein Q903MT_gene1150 [Picea sitchensis]
MELKASYPLQVDYGDSRIIIDRKALHLSFNDVMKVRILRIPIAPYLIWVRRARSAYVCLSALLRRCRRETH